MHKTLWLFALPTLLAAPAIAAPKPAKAKPPTLTCKTAAADGLTYTVIKAGKGDRPGADSKVKVNYKGMLTANGSEFDAGQGAEFKVGGVIPGFAQGLQLMQPGGSYRLCIPSKLGYGEAGTGPIPANADLVFEVDLLSFTTPPPKPVIPVAERACNQDHGIGSRLPDAQDWRRKNPHRRRHDACRFRHLRCQNRRVNAGKARMGENPACTS